MLPSASYFLRAQVIGGALTFYMQRGSLYDLSPESLKGTVNGASGGGFASTPLDMCLAWVMTGAPGSLPTIRTIYNRAQLTWTQTVNGTGWFICRWIRMRVRRGLWRAIQHPLRVP